MISLTILMMKITTYVDIAGSLSIPNLNEEILYHHPDVPPKVTIGKPCSENPCSYDAVQNILQHIKDHCK